MFTGIVSALGTVRRADLGAGKAHFASAAMGALVAGGRCGLRPALRTGMVETGTFCAATIASLE